MARCSITLESLPIEYSITGLANSAATSRMMWMLSASSARRWLDMTRLGGREEPVQQHHVDRDDGREHAVRFGALEDAEHVQERRDAEADDPRVEAHTDAAKRLRVDAPDDPRAERDPDEQAGHHHRREEERVTREEAGVPVRRRRQCSFSDANEAERRAELALRESLVVQEHRQRRTRDRRERVQRADPRAERQA